MANEIIGEAVKSGLIRKLRDTFGVAVYKEAVVNLSFPHFFVFQISVDTQPDIRNRWFLNYLVNIRYREANDIATVLNLQERLDAVGLRLLYELDYINLWGVTGGLLKDRTTIRNARYEKVDGVLHYFCNMTIYATKPIPEVEKQLSLDLYHDI